MLRLFKRNSYPELEAELHLLCREWFEGQIGHLPPDELPPQEEIEADVLEMRNDVYRKLSPMLKSSSALRGRKPNDAENDTTLANLVSAYSGRESTTPILTKRCRGISVAAELMCVSAMPLSSPRSPSADSEDDDAAHPRTA